MNRRGAGEGGVYRRADGRWTASVELPRQGGKRRRKVLYAQTRAELLAKMRDVQARQSAGLPILDAKRTTGEFLDYWVTEMLPGTVSANTLEATATSSAATSSLSWGTSHSPNSAPSTST